MNRLYSATADAAAASALPAAAPAHIMQPFAAQPGFLLARIDQIHTAIFADIAGDETPTQAEFLLLLAAAGPLDQASLARAAGVDTSTTALVVDNLIGRGLVTRAADRRDRRRARLELTPDGKRRLGLVRERFERTQALLVDALAGDEVTALLASLRRIGENPVSSAPPWVPPVTPGGGVAAVTASPGFLCRRALQVCQAGFLACTAALNLTPRQFSLLFILDRHPGLSQVGFARLFGLDPSTCAMIMKNLLRRGLLHRQVSAQDRRERLYSLTADGARALLATRPLADRADRLVFRAISRGERRRTVLRLQAIVRAHSHRLRFPGVLFQHR